jgi:DNA-binding CsgD family transcriptional regulator
MCAMSLARHAAPLVGRGAELAVLRERIDSIRDAGGAIVVRGEAGIGKSALLREAGRLATAAGLRVLTTAGVESETQVAFSGLDQLMRPVLGEVGILPGPQRRALLAAIGRTDAAAPDLFLIALATLNLLGEAATRAPILLLVEDAHWLDRASADVLGFVARRLDFEPVVLLAAMRDGLGGAFNDAGLAELTLGPLDDAAAATLLDARAPDLQPAVRERVLGEAAGNPLALVELPIVMGHLGDGAASAAWLPLTTRLEQAFAARVSGLSTTTRLLLLAAALNDRGVLAETLAAAAIVGGVAPSADDLTPAVGARLVEVNGPTVSFRHPLMRSAVAQRSSVGQRQLVHAAFAQVLAGDADRRVWHLAAAATGPDEGVASELEAAAGRARRRGGVEAAVAALDRAAGLSEDRTREGERLLRAAELAFELGRHDLVSGLLRRGAAIELSQRQRSRMVWIRERFDDGIRDVAAGVRSLVDLGGLAAADGDTGLALKLLWGAALRCFWTEPGQVERDAVVVAAERLPVDARDGRLLAILAFAAPIERGAVVIDRLRWLATHPSRRGRAARRADAALLVGAFDLAAGFCSTAIAELRAEGRLGLVARCLAAQAWSEAHLGDLSVAIPAAEEAARLSRESKQPIMQATAQVTQAMLAALRGEHDHAAALAAEAERQALPVTARPVLASVQHARGLAALGAGRNAEAYEQLRRMYDPADPAYHVALRCYAVGDLSEAAVHAGHGAAVDRGVTEMEAVASTTPSPALHVGLRYARALLADDGDAQALFEAALGADLARWPFARARVQLAYGGWLRRQRRAADSRGYLRAARDTFDALGTIPWGDRARQELRASGETSRRRNPDVRDQLTPQELQIAQMAAEGLTNREIGHKLYLSHRTISSHLHRIFPKLGVTSRSALRAALHPPV